MTNTLFDTIPFLDHPPILLRHIQESDLDNLWEIYSNPLHFQYTPNTSTKSKETLRKRISHFQRDFNKKKRLFLVLEFQGKLIAVLEVFDYKKRTASVTIGYRLHHAFWNQGLASRAVCSALPFPTRRMSDNNNHRLCPARKLCFSAGTPEK